MHEFFERQLYLQHRLAKLFQKFDELAVLVNGMIMGLTSVVWIALLLFGTLFIYSIIGILLFSDNDPFHFRDLHTSIITLFRCATLEDWTDVMYIQVYGCSNWGYDGMQDMCVHDNPAGFLISVAYFVSFTVLAAFIELTLFIGAVTTGMDEACAHMHIRSRTHTH